MIEEVGRITAREAAATGMHWTFSPVLGTARDLRWGRIDETFGEDPYLIGVLGSALIKGYQGKSLFDPDTILACAKHYAGYSGSQGGRDSYEAELSRRNLLSLYLRPFHGAVKAGCATIMTGYQSIDGVPCTANRWLMTEVLKETWGFDGFVVTDWNNVGRMHTEQMVCATIEEASQLAVEAGNDMMMSTPEFYDAAVQLVNEGRLDSADIDESCRRVLRLKFELGLFDDNRYPDLDKGPIIINCAEHRAVALESATQSMVLLKNEGDLLPLDDSIRRIAVIGHNADDIVSQLGDWSSIDTLEAAMNGEKYPQTTTHADTITVLAGIRKRAHPDCQVDYARGCDMYDPDPSGITEAEELAQQADVAVVVVGDTLSQNGEWRDRANLDLSGGQQQLVEAIYATGTPVVVVLINGKPLTIPWIAENIPAVLEAWNPGSEGGNAVADILFGDENPCGKLSISFPYHVGQQPVYYNQIPGWRTTSYVDMPAEPLYAFGYGLSYTTFAYSNLRLGHQVLAEGESLHVEIDVENIGQRAGTETVQLYTNDIYSSVTTPVKELKAFQRVELNPGEKKTVALTVTYEQLALVNQNLETIVEPGEFEVMVGSSSRDEDLLKAVFVVK